MLLLISLALLISCELQEWRQRGCHCPGMWTCNLFNFTPRASKPFRLADLTFRTKVPFAFHFLHDKRGEKSIVYCNAPSPFWHQQNWGAGKRSIQIKSKYKKSQWRRGATLPCLEIHLLSLIVLCLFKKRWGQNWKVKNWEHQRNYLKWIYCKFCSCIVYPILSPAGFTSKWWCDSSSGLV